MIFLFFAIWTFEFLISHNCIHPIKPSWRRNMDIYVQFWPKFVQVILKLSTSEANGPKRLFDLKVPLESGGSFQSKCFGTTAIFSENEQSLLKWWGNPYQSLFLVTLTVHFYCYGTSTFTFTWLLNYNDIFQKTVCQSDSKWSAPGPTCSRVSCGALDAPANGRLECTGDNELFGTRCEAICNEGFKLTDGDRIRICQDTTLWSGEPAQCSQIKCPLLSAPKHGRRLCSNSNLYGSKCRFVCEIGYEFHGNQERICQGNFFSNFFKFFSIFVFKIFFDIFF